MKKADAGRKPARVSLAVGREDGLAFNRRFHMTDGSVGWNPGKKNPKIVRPAGPTDPTVPVVLVETADKKPKPIAVLRQLRHAPRHGRRPVLLGRLPVHAVEGARRGEGRRPGDGVHHRLLPATSTTSTWTATSPQKGHGEAARIGTRLAAEVLRTFDKLKPAADGPLRVSSETVELPLPPVTAEDVAAAKLVIAEVQAGTKPAPKFLDQVQAFKAVDVADRLGKPLAVEVQVISLGDDLAWVSLPGEIFVRARAGDQGGLAVQADDDRGAGQRQHRVRPEPGGVPAGELRGDLGAVRGGQRREAGGCGAEATAGAVREVTAIRRTCGPGRRSPGRMSDSYRFPRSAALYQTIHPATILTSAQSPLRIGRGQRPACPVTHPAPLPQEGPPCRASPSFTFRPRAIPTNLPRQSLKESREVPSTTATLHRLVGEDMPGGRWKNPQMLAAISAADAIVFGTPTYMGGYSAQMKGFIDAASEVWFKLGWKDKVAAAFTHSVGLSGDKLSTLQGLWVNAMQHGMIWVGLGLLAEGTGTGHVNRIGSYGGTMAQTDLGQEKVNDGDRKTARLLGKRVAEATVRWAKGA